MRRGVQEGKKGRREDGEDKRKVGRPTKVD